jgi:Ca2+-binding EF-hand superfamily protein
MQLYDKNHDGKIDLQEFMAAMEIWSIKECFILLIIKK